jgi:hypothetical protein
LWSAWLRQAYWALGAQTAPAQEQEIGLLFAQTANRGTMKPIKGPTPRFNLRLYGVNPQVVWFADRPARQSGQIAVPDFTRAWPGLGFVDDPPNAALTLLDAGNRHDTVVMELGRPDFKPKKNRVRYSASAARRGDRQPLLPELGPRPPHQAALRHRLAAHRRRCRERDRRLHNSVLDQMP